MALTVMCSASNNFSTYVQIVYYIASTSIVNLFSFQVTVSQIGEFFLEDPVLVPYHKKGIHVNFIMDNKVSLQEGYCLHVYDPVHFFFYLGTLNDWMIMNNGLERIWKEAVMYRSEDIATKHNNSLHVV